ncbi:unnamed protein product [Allacma fusca]|uniref:Uncharacterized protein n=1 Tax=Allacma fusca TaxID=39272 RepID=A0A8J2JMI7_9HEXA|nr:unnamed protein product [Allacma fusca]
MDVLLNAKMDVLLNAKMDVLLNAKMDVPLNAKMDVLLKDKLNFLLNSKMDAALNANMDVLLNVPTTSGPLMSAVFTPSPGDEKPFKFFPPHPFPAKVEGIVQRKHTGGKKN